MSMVLTRSPLEPLGMNGAGTSKRRSARLSTDGGGENEPPAKKARPNGAHSTTVSTKEQDGDANGASKRRPRKVYEEEVDGFAFKKGTRKAKEAKQPAVRTSIPDEQPAPAVSAPVSTSKDAPLLPPAPAPAPVPSENAAPKPAQKKTRRRFPTTPEREAAEKPIRRSKRLSDENVSSEPIVSPFKSAHAQSHANVERSPSTDKARPITVEKKRKRGVNGSEEEEKIMRIALPFQDTPVIRRNKEMRKSTAGRQRRSSSGMRGQRASSLMDDGRGSGTYQQSPLANDALIDEAGLLAEESSEQAEPHLQHDAFAKLNTAVLGSPTPPPSDSTSPAQLEQPSHDHAAQSVQDTPADELLPDPALPHTEVPATEFFKHISADLTEPRRMRLLLGWCGTRALPPKPEAPKDGSAALNLEFQALQAARVIQEELSQDLVSNGTLSDWFSRDEGVLPKVPLRKAPNPRNTANAAKAEELERELERLKAQRADWDTLMRSAIPATPPANADTDPGAEVDGGPALSPLHPELLDSPQRAILETLNAPAPGEPSVTDPEALQQRLRTVAEDLEFTVDRFAHGMHALARTKEVAETLAEKTLEQAAGVLDTREKSRSTEGKGADALDALRALGKVLNGRRR
ncbi:hypothetical protein LTR53_011193 [Teratosphaeriaceae sp. CCFEE 6253]|nr:hypothetical protein LTR53_011193 [Teratosphaeriaceae sp. CCFEE 6253]